MGMKSETCEDVMSIGKVGIYGTGRNGHGAWNMSSIVLEMRAKSKIWIVAPFLI